MARILFITLFLLLQPKLWAKDARIHVFNKDIVDSDYKICVIGDPGTGGDGQYLVAEALANENCSQVRVVGDIIYPSGIDHVSDPILFEKLFNPYKNVFTGPFAPRFFLALGNHDYKKEEDAWLDVSNEYSDKIFFPNKYFFEIWNNEVCMLTLDTNMFAKIYALHKGLAQSIWLKKTFQKYEDRCSSIIAFGHHPFKSMGKHGNAKLLVKAFLGGQIKGHVDLYLAGHDHNLADEGRVAGTRFIVSGAGGKLRPLQKEPNPFEFGKSQLGYVTLELKRITGSEEIVIDYKFIGVKTKDGQTISEDLHDGFVFSKGIR